MPIIDEKETVVVSGRIVSEDELIPTVQPKKPSFLKQVGKYATATPETALSLFTGALAYPIGFAGEVGALAAGQSPETAQDFRQYVSNLYTYQPRSKEAQHAFQQASNILGLPLKPAEKLKEYVSEKVSPMAGEIVGLPAEALTVLGLPKATGKAREARINYKQAKAMKQAQVEFNNVVDSGLEKGIRPSARLQKTAAQAEKYKSNGRSAVKSIVENKENLEFLDTELGEVVKGKLPQNLRQFSQAIEQTKSTIFKEYDALAKQAGKAEAKVDLGGIASELEKVANNKVVIDMAPKVADYANKRAEALKVRGNYSAVEAQEAIQILNNSLDAFYKNPSYETATNAYIDSLVVNNLRKSLDTAIEKATGKEYQALKNEYGALKTIERDVNRRAAVDARKNAKGLLDFSNIFTSYEIIRGILAANPAIAGAGFSARLISGLYKKLNDPNRTISKMFEKADKSMTRKLPASPNIPWNELEAPIPPESKMLFDNEPITSFETKGGPTKKGSRLADMLRRIQGIRP